MSGVVWLKSREDTRYRLRLAGGFLREAEQDLNLRDGVPVLIILSLQWKTPGRL